MTDLSLLDAARFRFENLAHVEAAIARYGARDDAGYVYVRDRTNAVPGAKSEAIGRYNFTAAQLEEWREERAALDDDDLIDTGARDPSLVDLQAVMGDGKAEADDEMEAAGAGETAAADAGDDVRPSDSPAPTDERREIVEGACEWLRTKCIRYSLGAAIVRFRVDIRSVKGNRQLFTGIVTCSDTDIAGPVRVNASSSAAGTDPHGGVPMPTPDWPRGGNGGAPNGADAALAMFVGPMQTVMAGATSAVRLVLGAMSTVELIQRRQLSALFFQVRAIQSQNGMLARAIAERDTAVRTRRSDDAAEEAERAHRAQLGSQAMSMFGTLGKLFLAGKNGLSPELVTLMTFLEGDPELKAILNDEKLQTMMRDPKWRNEILEAVKLASEGYANMGTSSPNPGDANAGNGKA